MSIDAIEYPLNTLTDGARKIAGRVDVAATILANFNGNETINQNRSQHRRRFNASYGVRTLANAQTLIAFFNAQAGPVNGFLVKDWIDFQVTRTVTTLSSSPTTITTQGVATNTTGAIWQLQKKYTVASRSHLRNILRPKNTTVSVWFDGVAKTAGVDYSIDYTTGLLTVLLGTPTAITWTGEFFVPCRFAQKELPADLLLYRSGNGSGNADLSDVPLIELL
jgi:uncharacterized protein (TIGR02217 family)